MCIDQLMMRLFVCLCVCVCVCVLYGYECASHAGDLPLKKIHCKLEPIYLPILFKCAYKQVVRACMGTI